MTSLKEIARQAGVSINTVSRVLNGQNKESWNCIAERSERIRQIALELDYRPNSAARAMRKKETRHVGVLMSGGYTTPYEFPVIIGINEVLQAAGYILNIINASEIDSERPQDAPSFREQMLAGIFIMHVPEALGKYASTVAKLRIALDSNVREAHNCIFRDEAHSGRTAAMKLEGKGYRKLVYVGFSPWEDNCHFHVADRLRGVRTGAKEAGAALDEIELQTTSKDWSGAVDRLIDCLNPETGVITTDQGVAQWCANTALREGLRPGRDFALASCSDMMDCSQVWPWLSRVTFDRIELGRKAAGMMKELLAGRREIPSVELKGDWLEGETAPQRKTV